MAYDVEDAQQGHRYSAWAWAVAIAGLTRDVVIACWQVLREAARRSR